MVCMFGPTPPLDIRFIADVVCCRKIFYLLYIRFYIKKKNNTILEHLLFIYNILYMFICSAVCLSLKICLRRSRSEENRNQYFLTIYMKSEGDMLQIRMYIYRVGWQWPVLKSSILFCLRSVFSVQFLRAASRRDRLSSFSWARALSAPTDEAPAGS